MYLYDTEPAHRCFGGEPRGQLGSLPLECCSVDPGAGNGFPCYPIFTGLQGFSTAHSGLDFVLEGFSLGLCLLDDCESLAQLTGFAFDLSDTHVLSSFKIFGNPGDGWLCNGWPRLALYASVPVLIGVLCIHHVPVA